MSTTYSTNQLIESLSQLKAELNSLAKNNNYETLIEYSFAKLQEIFDLDIIQYKEAGELTTRTLNKLDRDSYIKRKDEDIFSVRNTSVFLALQIIRKPRLSELEQNLLKDFFADLGHIFESMQIQNDLSINNERLLQKDRDKNQIISTISHELKTPLATILGFAEIMSSQSLDSTITQNYSKEILKSSKRLENLIRNFLDMSRVENAGTLQLNSFEELEIDFIVQEAWEQVSHLSKKHQINWTITKKLSNIYGDADALTRVFTNLLFNAIKYSPAAASETKIIDCSITKQESEIIISIQDYGIGIAESDHERIFKRFERLSNASERNINGTGLGLWICKQIVTAHGGKIWFESNLDKGSTFFVALKTDTQDERKILLL